MTERTRFFAENRDGVHLVSMSEYTLCGDALEGDPANGIEETHDTPSRTVTCRRCVEIIVMCRGVRVKPAATDPGASA